MLVRDRFKKVWFVVHSETYLTLKTTLEAEKDKCLAPVSTAGIQLAGKPSLFRLVVTREFYEQPNPGVNLSNEKQKTSRGGEKCFPAESESFRNWGHWKQDSKLCLGAGEPSQS